METMVVILGELLLELLQAVWPPVLAILTGVLVLFLSVLSCLYYTAGHPVKAVGSLPAALLFLVVLVAGFRAGIYTRRTRKNQRKDRRK